MTPPSDNHILTQTGPGTPMGKLFRRYWLPFLLAEELPEPDCAPVKVKLLSEELLAFRSTDGTIGLIDEYCAHRRVSLWFGRNEQNGIRCPYHGWKYDTNGLCVEIPSEGGDASSLGIKLASYPCIEQGGVIWAYMGPPELQPPAPSFEWATVPASQRYVCKRLQESNYLQAMEGGIDSSHVSSLHSGELATDPLHQNSEGAGYQRDTAPEFQVETSDGGLMIGAKRKAADDDAAYWRVTQWIMPFFTMIPPYGDNSLHGHAWVPIDDEHCFAWTMTHHPARDLKEDELNPMQAGEGIYAELIPGTYKTVANKDNDYLMDRAAQKTGRYYSGIKGIAMQDASLQESMGAVVDRSRERLVATDIAIVRARRRLLSAAKSLSDTQTEVPGVAPAHQAVRSASFVMDANRSLLESGHDFSASQNTEYVSI